MKKETVLKRITVACKKCPFIDNETKLQKMVDCIYIDFLHLENTSCKSRTSTQNLNFAIFDNLSVAISHF